MVGVGGVFEAKWLAGGGVRELDSDGSEAGERREQSVYGSSPWVRDEGCVDGT